MELQKFLQQHNDDWEEILGKEPYCLKWHRWGDGFISFKYRQECSDFSIPLVREARGCVFKEGGVWSCICRGFDKFFNYGEELASDVEWESSRVMEKVDGSLIKVFYYNGWYAVSNSGFPLFEISTGNPKYKTFTEVFYLALEKMGYSSIKSFVEGERLSKVRTYMFELVSPYTRATIPYPETKLYYLGERARVVHTEFFLPEKRNLVEIPKTYKMRSFEDVVRSADELPWDDEGYVVVDKDFNRIKVKSPKWVLAHYMRNNNVVTKKRLMEVILAGEVEEFMTYADDYRLELEELLRKKSSLQKEAELLRSLLHSHFSFTSQKELASVVSKIKNPYIRLFCYGEKSWEEMTKLWPASKWVSVLEQYNP